MRRRISKALIATGAAGATITTLGFAAAGAAGAMTTGPESASTVHAPSAPSIATPPCAAATGYLPFPTFFRSEATKAPASPNAAAASLGDHGPTFGLGGCAGYVASGRNFRYTQATIRVPLVDVGQAEHRRGPRSEVPEPTPTETTPTANPTETATTAPTMAPMAPAAAKQPDQMEIGSPGTTAPILYTALSSSNSAAVAGLISCQGYHDSFGAEGLSSDSPCAREDRTGLNAGYYPRIWIAFGVVATNTSPFVHVRGIALPAARPGDGIKFQVYYNQVGNAVHFTIIRPDGTTIAAFSEGARGAVYDHAEALADWSLCPTRHREPRVISGEQGPGLDEYGARCDTTGFPHFYPVPGPVPFNHQRRITQFQGIAWTTASGDRGSVTGPWTTNSVVATSNGLLPPSGTIEVTPQFLWTSGLTGRSNDSFGVWWV